jgi:hypothetical protein
LDHLRFHLNAFCGVGVLAVEDFPLRFLRPFYIDPEIRGFNLSQGERLGCISDLRAAHRNELEGGVRSRLRVRGRNHGERTKENEDFHTA